MSDPDPLFPRHGNSGPAPEVTPPTLRVLVASFLDGERIQGSERYMDLMLTKPSFSCVLTAIEWPK